MTPPKVEKRGIFLEWGEGASFNPNPPLTPPLLLKTPEVGFRRREPSFLSEGFHLQWNPPSLWDPSLDPPIFLAQANLPPPPPPPPLTTVTPPPSTVWTTHDTWQFLTDFFLLVESMDARGKKMTANGGQGGCRYSEMISRDKLTTEEAKKCLVMFEENTHTSVDLRVRKLRDRDESKITTFRLTYDKPIFKDTFPANQVSVQGFQFVPVPEGQSPFYQEVDPNPKNGYELRYFVKPRCLLGIPIIGYPLFKGIAEPSDELDITKDWLLSWGLEDPALYKEAHTPHFRIPENVADFFRLLRHIETDDNKVSIVNVNTLKGKPRLFDWLSFEDLRITAHLRDGTLNIPHVGSFTFSRQRALSRLSSMEDESKRIKWLDQTARIDIHGTPQKMEVRMSHPEITAAEFGDDRYQVKFKGLNIDSVKCNFPPLKKFIDQLKRGIFRPEDLKIRLEGVTADEVTFIDKQTGMITTLQGARIGSLTLQGTSNIQLSGIYSKQIKFERPASQIEITAESATIPSISFTRQGDKTKLVLSRVEGGKTKIKHSGTSIAVNSEKARLTDFQWVQGKDSSHLEIGEILSTGHIQYEAPSGVSFHTSGKSKLTNIKVDYHLNADNQREITANFGLAGTISHLEMARAGVVSTALSDSVIRQGNISMTARLSDGDSPTLMGLKYSIDLELEKANLDKGQLGFIALAPSTLTEGHLTITHDTWDFTTLPDFNISGDLDFHIQQLVGTNESFNLPGLLVSGKISDVHFHGKAQLRSTPTGWIFEKITSPEPTPLTASARLHEVHILQDPHQIPGTKLHQWPSSQVVKTDLRLTSAELAIDDIEYLELSSDTRGREINNFLSRMKINGAHIRNIEAGGVAWAKFPIFYYLRGLFPKIGTIGSGPDMKTSFVDFGSFEISLEEGKPVTTVRGFKTELYEVGGREQFAKIAIPFIKIFPMNENPVDTGGEQVTLDVSLKDPPRGGRFYFKSVPRPLEERRSRVPSLTVKWIYPPGNSRQH